MKKRDKYMYNMLQYFLYTIIVKDIPLKFHLTWQLYYSVVIY